MYRGFLVDGRLVDSDPHFAKGCQACHGGNHTAEAKESAHVGLNKKPSRNLATCGECHKGISEKFSTSLHYTSHGQKMGVKPRFNEGEFKHFEEKIFEQSCRSCHASCGDCHVKGAPVSGISIGLIEGHKFIRKNEEKTCAFCHGGRVYTEFTGEYGGSPDVHFTKGMQCLDCHQQMHGDGTLYNSKQEVKSRPKCSNCHNMAASDLSVRLRTIHGIHQEKASCYACHADGNYRNCYSCHGGHSEAQPGFILGKNPRNTGQLTTLRVIPTLNDTFTKQGLNMSNFDALPNYWDSPVHAIKKKTRRTRDCDACHVDRRSFLEEGELIEGGAKANKELIPSIKPIK
ncbi:MAG: hypothetical protein K9K75_00525 [Deltaproteobacteria bacterium]|nr:hypothetical protein [Deltaproteobacteria bacterium]